MSHLLHPHPKATKIDLAEPLAGVILISPWTNLFPIQTEESIFNETSDVITIDAGRRWSALFLGKSLINSLGIASLTTFSARPWQGRRVQQPGHG